MFGACWMGDGATGGWGRGSVRGGADWGAAGIWPAAPVPYQSPMGLGQLGWGLLGAWPASQPPTPPQPAPPSIGVGGSLGEQRWPGGGAAGGLGGPIRLVGCRSVHHSDPSFWLFWSSRSSRNSGCLTFIYIDGNFLNIQLFKFIWICFLKLA